MKLHLSLCVLLLSFLMLAQVIGCPRPPERRAASSMSQPLQQSGYLSVDDNGGDLLNALD